MLTYANRSMVLTILHSQLSISLEWIFKKKNEFSFALNGRTLLKEKPENRSAAERCRRSFDLNTRSIAEFTSKGFAIQSFDLHKKLRFVAVSMTSFAHFREITAFTFS